jgi:lysylphosphatidylglycerol synthetase-like protein (DUF2156 family)
MTYLILGLIVIVVIYAVEVFFIKVGGKSAFGTENGCFQKVGKFVANLFKKIFPPANEITVFVITVTLLSMFIYMDGWFANTISIASEGIENVLHTIHESNSFKDTAVAYSSFVIVPLLFVLLVFGPLFLPFNKRDLRGLCLFMIFAHAIIIAYTNITLGKESPSIMNTIVVLYSIAWVIYIYAVGEMRKQDHMMNKHQTKAMPSLVAASVSVIAVFLAINVFSVSWYRAYSIGSISTSCLVALVSAQYYGMLYHDEKG